MQSLPYLLLILPFLPVAYLDYRTNRDIERELTAEREVKHAE